jgi:heavy metal sensor kinase
VTLSIRTRLMLWYSAVLAGAFGALSVLAWIGMEASLFRTLDADLVERIGEAGRQFAEGSADDVLQVRAADADWVFRSDLARRENVPLDPLPPGSAPRLSTIDIGGLPHRSIAASVLANGRTYTLQIAEPLRDVPGALRRFATVLVVAMPAMLLVAGAGGYWISRRALAPVDSISADARAITAQDLSRRLEVPQTGDELQRLSETLNDMLARLETAFARTRDFTADASHELRTPIAFMRTVADVALRRPRSDADYREALEEIRLELDRTAALVESLLTLARADAAGTLTSRETVDLVAIVNAACTHAKRIAEEKRLRLETPADNDPIAMVGNRELLHRLFGILLDNAVKYTPPGGRIDVRVVKDDGRVRVGVRDSGIGITPEDVEHVFERFYRADKARTRENGGAGLGLAIGRWIAETHGGTLTVESELNRGSTFTVVLPRPT